MKNIEIAAVRKDEYSRKKVRIQPDIRHCFIGGFKLFASTMRRVQLIGEFFHQRTDAIRVRLKWREVKNNSSGTLMAAMLHGIAEKDPLRYYV